MSNIKHKVHRPDLNSYTLHVFVLRWVKTVNLKVNVRKKSHNSDYLCVLDIFRRIFYFSTKTEFININYFKSN